MPDAGDNPSKSDQATDLQGGDADDRILAALAHLKAGAGSIGEAQWKDSPFRQKSSLKEWADGLGLRLNASDYLPRLVRGGQEHDVIPGVERYIKVTRDGVFGLTPGIELALVSSSQDARRFHLWEASPYQYLERLRLQNELTKGLNRLEGIIIQSEELTIVISQPTFDIVPVSQSEIDAWFESLGFHKITTAAYYREEDNLGIFDAHDKNLVRAGGTLVPFDVIPCHPDGGFLEFIEETLAAGHSLRAVRSSHTGKHEMPDM